MAGSSPAMTGRAGFVEESFERAVGIGEPTVFFVGSPRLLVFILNLCALCATAV